MAYQAMSPLGTSTAEHQKTEHMQLAAAKKAPQPDPMETARHNIEQTTRALIDNPPPPNPAAETINETVKAIQQKPATLPTPIPSAPKFMPGS